MDGFKKSVLINAGLILASFLIFLVAIWFMGNLIRQNGVQLVGEFSDYFSRTYAAERLLSLKQTESQAQVLQTKMEALLPAQDEVYFNFPGFIKDAGATYGVSLSLVYPGAITPPAASAPGSVSFSFTASGSLESLNNFLNLLETKTKQYWLGIDSANFTRNGNSYSLNASGKVFFRP